MVEVQEVCWYCTGQGSLLVKSKSVEKCAGKLAVREVHWYSGHHRNVIAKWQSEGRCVGMVLRDMCQKSLRVRC